VKKTYTNDQGASDPHARNREAAPPPSGCLLLMLAMPWSLIIQPIN